MSTLNVNMSTEQIISTQLKTAVDKTPLAMLLRLPPPTNGATLVSARILAELGDQFDPNVFNINISSKTSTRIHYYWRMTLRMLLAPLWLVVMRLKGIRRLYAVPDHGNGLFGNLLSITIARLLGMRCYLHHHSYSYVDCHDWRMSLIDRMMGTTGVHITLCDDMTENLRNQYHSRSLFLRVGNFFMVDPPHAGQETSATERSSFRLGLLSNLTIEKGLQDAIDLLDLLKSNQHDVTLVLAGPCSNAESKAALDRAQAKFGAAIDYRGFVTGEAKSKFYHDIDVFLFPTHWKAEAQPLVLLEALVVGRPVLTFSRGGIAELLGEAGHAFQRDADFARQSLPVIERWIRSPEQLRTEGERSIERASELVSGARADLASLRDILLI